MSEEVIRPPKPKLSCRLSWHHWTLWAEYKQDFVVFALPDKQYTVNKQSRTCIHCGIKQTRSLNDIV